MTEKAYNDILKAMEEHRQWLLSDKKAAVKYLKKLGVWQLSVPIKKRNSSPTSARKK